MRAKRPFLCSLALAVLSPMAMADVFGKGENQFTIDFVTITGDASSANGTPISGPDQDPDMQAKFVDPGHDYRMGIYEITNEQWKNFCASIGVPVIGDEGYRHKSYSDGDRTPTTAVSFYEAAQFVNWLNTSNGHHAAYNFTGKQGTVDYTFSDWPEAEAAPGTKLYRHKDAMYFIPTECEWVKAAYWNGKSIQMYSNASSKDLDFERPSHKGWCYGAGTYIWNVGSGLKELNGTFDMMGNADEWTETLMLIMGDRGQIIRGGCWGIPANYGVASNYRAAISSNAEEQYITFRVASKMLQPGSPLLCSVGEMRGGGSQARAAFCMGWTFRPVGGSFTGVQGCRLYDIAAGGKVAAGGTPTGHNGPGFAVRWSGSKFEPLGRFHTPMNHPEFIEIYSRALGISADGKVIVGGFRSGAGVRLGVYVDARG